MSDQDSNRAVLEKFAREVLQAKTQEEIDAFVNTFVYIALLN